MKRFFSIIKFILRVKIILNEPKNYKLVIFDGESLTEIKSVIPKIDYFVMQDRINDIDKIYLSFKIFKLFLRNYNGNIKTSYFVSLLQIIKPKAVITFIDNSIKFSDLAKILNKEIKFIAILNAYRLEIIENDYLYKKKLIKINLNKRFYIPKLLAYGQCDIDIYKKYKIKVKKFVKVGNVRLANALEYIKKKKIKLKRFRYDVCVMSDTTSNAHFLNIEKKNAESGKYVEDGAVYTVKYSINYCIKHKKKFIFVLKTNTSNKKGQIDELNFYKKFLTENEFNFLISNTTKNKTGLFVSHITMFQSNIAIGTISTMLGEYLGLGGKILACNFTKMKVLDYPIKGICFIRNPNFEQFEKKLTNILSVNKKKYFSKLNKSKNYIVAHDKKYSPISLIKKEIMNAIK